MQLAITTLAPLLSLVVVGAAPKLAAAAPLASWGAALHAQTAPAAGSREERAATAAAYYEQNRTVEAALGFEGLWRDYPDQPDYLFNAAASRFAAGHFAHAIARTDEYLALATTRGAERQAAEAQRRAAVVQTGAAAVTVKLGGSSDAVEIVAQFVTRDSSDIRPELAFTAAPQSAKTLQLDPGVWMVRARAAGHAPAEQQIEVTRGQTTPVSLELALAPADSPDPVVDDRPRAPREVPQSVRRRMSIGFGVAGGVIAAAGIGVVALGSVEIGKARDCTEGRRPCGDALGAGVDHRGAGFTVLGAGLGLLAGGLPWLSKSADTRKKVWIAEAAIGGAAAVGGIAVLAATSGAFIESVAAGDLTAKAPANVAGMMMFGVGAGAVISAVTGLIVQRHHLRRAPTVGASAARGQFGLTLSGRF